MKQKVLSTKSTKSYVKKYKPNGEIEFIPVYSNSTTKIVINNELILKMLFQKFCAELITGLMKDLVGLLN